MTPPALPTEQLDLVSEVAEIVFGPLKGRRSIKRPLRRGALKVKRPSGSRSERALQGS